MKEFFEMTDWTFGHHSRNENDNGLSNLATAFLMSLELFPNLTSITLNFSSDSAVYQAALNLDAGIPGLFLELANIINLKYTKDRERAPQIHLPADLIDAWINKVRALLHPSQRTDDSTDLHGAIAPAGAPNPQESLDVPAGLPEEQVAAILYVIDNVFLLEKPCVFLSETQINTILAHRKSLAALVSSKQDPVQAAQAAQAAELAARTALALRAAEAEEAAARVAEALRAVRSCRGRSCRGRSCTSGRSCRGCRTNATTTTVWSAAA